MPMVRARMPLGGNAVLSASLTQINCAPHRPATISRMRTARLTLIAVFAVLAALLQPLCATYAAAQDAAAHFAAQDSGGEDGPCCSDVDSASLVAPSSATLANVLIAAPEPTLALPRTGPAEQARLLDRPLCCTRPPPPPLSYHARSARSLR